MDWKNMPETLLKYGFVKLVLQEALQALQFLQVNIEELNLVKGAIKLLKQVVVNKKMDCWERIRDKPEDKK